MRGWRSLTPPGAPWAAVLLAKQAQLTQIRRLSRRRCSSLAAASDRVHLPCWLAHFPPNTKLLALLVWLQRADG